MHACTYIYFRLVFIFSMCVLSAEYILVLSLCFCVAAIVGVLLVPCLLCSVFYRLSHIVRCLSPFVPVPVYSIQRLRSPVFPFRSHSCQSRLRVRIWPTDLIFCLQPKQTQLNTEKLCKILSELFK